MIIWRNIRGGWPDGRKPIHSDITEGRVGQCAVRISKAFNRTTKLVCDDHYSILTFKGRKLINVEMWVKSAKSERQEATSHLIELIRFDQENLEPPPPCV